MRRDSRRVVALGVNLLCCSLCFGCGNDPVRPARIVQDAADDAQETSRRDSAADRAVPGDVDAGSPLDGSPLDAGPEVDDSSDVTTEAASDGPSESALSNDGSLDGQSSSDGGLDARDGVAEDDAKPSTACSVYCACMSATCTSYLGYPYLDEASCFRACRDFSLEESVCFRGFCISAEQEPVPANREHSCQHAWGAYGLLEC